MAKPTPDDVPEPERIAVFMPIISPAMFTSAPPELPGLIAASVWRKSETSVTPTFERASAETIPLVTVWPTPNGSPMASTRSPTWVASPAASGITGSCSPATSIFKTATSTFGSANSTLAGNSRRSPSATMMSSPPAITWLLVTITPSERTMTPEPSDLPDALARSPCRRPNIRKKGSTLWRITRA